MIWIRTVIIIIRVGRKFLPHFLSWSRWQSTFIRNIICECLLTSEESIMILLDFAWSWKCLLRWIYRFEVFWFWLSTSKWLNVDTIELKRKYIKIQKVQLRIKWLSVFFLCVFIFKIYFSKMNIFVRPFLCTAGDDEFSI